MQGMHSRHKEHRAFIEWIKVLEYAWKCHGFTDFCLPGTFEKGNEHIKAYQNLYRRYEHKNQLNFIKNPVSSAIMERLLERDLEELLLSRLPYGDRERG